MRLVGLGPLPGHVAQRLARALSAHVRAACLWEARPLPDALRVPGRDQLDADRLLETLEAEPCEAETLLVGVTAADIAIPIFTFVFGRARTPGRAALVSMARLEPAFYGLPEDEASTLRRLVDEVRHEMGHLAGLKHCREPQCLMAFAGSVAIVDARGSSFCGPCRALLPAAFG